MGAEPPRINHLGRSPRLIDLAHSAPLAAGWSPVNDQSNKEVVYGSYDC